MESRKLMAEMRSGVGGGRVKSLRRMGMLPAVLYGPGIQPQNLQLNAHDSSKALMQSTGATLFDLQVGEETHKVLVREIQRDVIRNELLHVDFLKVAMDVAIRAEVPIELVGSAPAVKEFGGVLVPGISEIEVEALPADLPDRITIDLEPLKNIEDSITVADLFFGKNVRVLTDPSETVAHVIYQAVEVEEVEEEAAEAVEAVGAEPELVERGKREEEEESGE
jgi:large subunit ribosomal protein L25